MCMHMYISANICSSTYEGKLDEIGRRGRDPNTMVVITFKEK